MTYGWWDDDDKPAKAAKPAAKAAPVAAAPARGTTDSATWARFARTYQRCRDVAVKTWEGVKDVDLVAATATLFIQAERMGLAVEVEAKPAPVKKPQPIEEYPEALADDESEELPY